MGTVAVTRFLVIAGLAKMNPTILLGLLAAVILHGVDATSTGALSSVCASMDPSDGHYSAPQTGTSPYTVTASRTNYTAGTLIYVTLQASGLDEGFKGFLVQARRAVPSQDVNEIIGLFTPVQNSKTLCGVHPVSNGLTHDSPQQKLSLTFKWTAPPDPDADIVFRATFVQTFQTYWVHIESPVVHLQKPLTTSTTSPATTTTTTTLRTKSTDVPTSPPPTTKTASAVTKTEVTTLSTSSTSSAATTSPHSPPTTVVQPPSTTKTASAVTKPAVTTTLSTSPTSSATTTSPGTSPTTVVQPPATTKTASAVTTTLSTSSTSSASTTSPGTPTTSLTAVGSKFVGDEACESTKGCYGDCDTSGCTFQVTWQLQEDNIYLTLKSVFNNGGRYWMAVGFSADKQMGNDSISECVVVDGITKVFQSYNDGVSNTRLQNASVGISLVSESVKNNVFECSFLRKKSVADIDKIFDIGRPWHVLFTRGVAYADYGKQRHDFTSASPSALSMTNYSSAATTPNQPDQESPSTVTAGNKFAKDGKCGVTMGCFHDCNNVGCTFQVTWQQDGSTMRIGLKSIVPSGTNSWMAVGFSSDNRMGDDSVNECVAVDQTFKVFSSFNTGRNNDRISSQSLGLRLVSGSLKDSVFECSFLRAKSITGNIRIFSLSKPWVLMFAQGAATTDFSTRRHSSWPSISHGLVDLEQVSEARSRTPTYYLVKAHGCLMIIAWIFAVSIGLIAARYYKSMWSEVTILGLKIWFQIHRTCMALAFVATCIGFILIFIDVQGYSQIEGEDYKKAHPVLGIIVTVLVIINPIMSIFRPGAEDAKRPLFNWAHWAVGTSAYILGVLTIFFGLQLDRATAPFHLTYILAGYVAWQVFITLVLEAVIWLVARQYFENKTNQIQMDGVGSVEENTTTNSLPGYSIKKIILALHIAVVSVITVASIVVLAVN